MDLNWDSVTSQEAFHDEVNEGWEKNGEGSLLILAADPSVQTVCVTLCIFLDSSPQFKGIRAETPLDSALFAHSYHIQHCHSLSFIAFPQQSYLSSAHLISHVILSRLPFAVLLLLHFIATVNSTLFILSLQHDMLSFLKHFTFQLFIVWGSVVETRSLHTCIDEFPHHHSSSMSEKERHLLRF